MKIFLFLSAVLAICSFAYAITMTVPILADGIEHIIQLNPSQSTRLKFVCLFFTSTR